VEMSDSEVTSSTPVAPTNRFRRPLMIAGPALVVAVAAFFYVTGGRYEETDDAYVRAGQISVSSNVPGRVAEVLIRDNQRVSKGQLLYKLDDRPFRIAVEEAQAKLESTRLEVESLKAN